MQQSKKQLTTKSEKVKTRLLMQIGSLKVILENFKNKIEKLQIRWVRLMAWFLIGGVSTTVIGGVLGYGAFLLAYRDKIFPGVQVGGVNVAEKGSASAGQILAQVSDGWLNEVGEIGAYLAIDGDSQEWSLKAEAVKFEYDIPVTVEEAFRVGREGSIIERLKVQWQVVTNGRTIPYSFNYKAQEFETQVATIAGEVDTPAVPPSLEIQTGAEGKMVAVMQGESGKEVDQERLKELWEERMGYLSSSKIALPINVVETEITQGDAERTKETAEKLVSKQLGLAYIDNQTKETQSWVLKDEDLITFLDFKDHIDEEKVGEYVVEIANTIDRPAQNAVFQFDASSNRVVEFKPAKDGLVVDQKKLVADFVEAVNLLEAAETVAPVTIVVTKGKPEITTGAVNDLGIKELLGRGDSTFYGSIPGRVHNVVLTAQKLNGTLVKPGETFSFNASIGEVSAATGYQPAYIIRAGRTVLDDGGGVCQDSTTTFRAALDAGLPIVERRAHAYRVGYYEQNAKAGLDATVYAPRVDLKFKNDTPGHILVQAYGNAGTKTLVVEIYGTSDGRVSEISNHKIWDITPPPPDLYQDDPSLPAGVIKQVDWKAWGAKAKFDYTVRRGGEVIYEKTFYSSFRPWQSVFLRGTQ